MSSFVRAYLRVGELSERRISAKLISCRVSQQDTCNVLLTFASSKARKRWLDVLQAAAEDPDGPTVFVSCAHKIAVGWHSTTFSGKTVEKPPLTRDTAPRSVMLFLSAYQITTCWSRKRTL